MPRELRGEQRRYRRIEAGYPVTLFCQGETYRVKATNLSLGGVFIATKLPLRAGALVHMRLGLPDRSFIQATGQVRFMQPGVGVGIRFFEITERDLQRIGELVEGPRAETPALAPGQKPRDTRLRITIKLALEGRDQNGESFTEEVYTEDVSRRGVCVCLNHQVGVGEIVKLTGLDGQFQVEGVIKYSHLNDGQWRAGVHFLAAPKRWVVIGMAVSALSQWDVKSVS
jgi:hypothetical protein